MSANLHARQVLNGCACCIFKVVHDTRGADGAAGPLEFNTGMDEVPEAVDMAVRLMTPGEASLVRAASRYAFDGRPDRPQVRHPPCHVTASVEGRKEIQSKTCLCELDSCKFITCKYTTR